MTTRLCTAVALVSLAILAAGATATAESESAQPEAFEQIMTGANSEWFVDTDGDGNETTCVDDFSEDVFNVEEAELVAPEQDDTYDGAYAIYVDGAPYDPGSATTSNANDVVGAVQALGGLDVTSSYRTFTGNDVFRHLAAFTNTGVSPVSVEIAWGHDMGSDNNTQIEDSASGDTSYEAADQWVVSSDGGSSPDPVHGFAIHGFDDPTTPFTPQAPSGLDPDCGVLGTSGTLDELGVLYDLTVPAGATCGLLAFGNIHEYSSGIPDAIAQTEALSSIGAAGSPFLEGLSPEQVNSVVNFDLGGDPATCEAAVEEPPPPAPPTAGPVPAAPPFTG